MIASSQPRAAKSGRRFRRRWLVPLVLLVLPLATLASDAASAGELWYRLDVASLNLVQAVTQRYVTPWLWDPVAVAVLQWPAWVVASIPALLAAVVCALWRRR